MTNHKLASKEKTFNKLCFILTIILSGVTITFGQNGNHRINKSIVERHIFSSTGKKDTFKLKMTGDNILSSQIEFQIISFSGVQIFKQIFPSTYLIGYGLSDINNPSDSDKENFILKRFSAFFDQSNFHNPAISKDVIFDADYYNPQYFDIIKNQDNCISFIYLLGEEDTSAIAYLRHAKKVVKFWGCC
jgi:hypothetical protein